MASTTTTEKGPVFELDGTSVEKRGEELPVPTPHRTYVPDEKKQKDPAVVVNLPASPSAQDLEVVAATVTQEGYFRQGDVKAAEAAAAKKEAEVVVVEVQEGVKNL